MILVSFDKQASCCLTSMKHNQIVKEVSETRMTTKYIVMVSHQVYCITIKWYVFHAWLVKKGIPSGEKSRKCHVK